MPVPLLDVNAQNHPLESELTAAFQRVLGHGQFILGREVQQFEQEVQEFLGVKHAIAVSSGTDALSLALMAMNVGPGDEVICPAFTFFATAGCVSRLGATPVFADVSLKDFNIDVDHVASLITPRTKVLVPVHLFGQSAHMAAIISLAEKHGLQVLEDAAQSFGALQNGRQCGTMGQMGAYSFFPSKNLGALGDAGLLVTDDAELAQRSRILRVHGMEPKYYHPEVGANFRIDALQAAFLSVKLQHYAAYTAARQANAAYYLQQLADLAPAHLILPSALPENTHIWNQFTLRVIHGRRDALKQHLTSAGIGCDIYYPVTLPGQECYRSLPSAPCPNSEQLAAEVLSIPVYPELPDSGKAEVAAAIHQFFQNS